MKHLLDITRIRDRLRVALISDRRFLERRYRREIGVPLDLDNPMRMTALLNWQKLNDRDPRYTVCADKLAVRQFVAETAGRELLIPLLASGRRWSDLDYSTLEEPFIIKTTHGSGGYRIVLDKAAQDERELKRFFRRHLERNHYHRLREWQYDGIEPGLMVERLLLDEKGQTPPDYKFHCFNTHEGLEIVVLVLTGRGVDQRAAYFDESWNNLPFEWSAPRNAEPPSRPVFLPELLRTAGLLAAGFCYVRVDLYWARDQVFFGELTFTPTSGLRRIVPDEWDFILGEKLRRTGILDRAAAS